MNITRRSLLHTTALLALATALPAAETHATVTLRLTWLDHGRVRQVDYQIAVQGQQLGLGRVDLGQGCELLVEEVPHGQ